MLLIINDNLSKDQQASLIPEQSKVTELSKTAKATVLAIQTQKSVPNAIQLISAQAQEPIESVVR